MVGLGYLVHKGVYMTDEVFLRDGGWAVPDSPCLEWL